MYKIRRRIAAVIIVFCFILLLSSCSSGNPSNFSITFIDVGQGDAALVSCDGHYMLVDGGPKGAGEKVYNTLVDNKVTHLDILAISHLDTDHIGGLVKALTYATKTDLVLSITDHYVSNAFDDHDDSKTFNDLSHELSINGSSITVPKESDKYTLGSAKVEIIAVGDPSIRNDSLIILVTYGKDKFLFTGDMTHNMEINLCEKYHDNFPISLLKVSHHGSAGKDDNTEISSIRFLDMLKLNYKYAVISVGENNSYGHPHEQTLSRLEQEDVKVYRTDIDGTIVVTSNGSALNFKTEK